MGWQDAPLANAATPSNSWETAPVINETLPVNPYEATFKEALQNVPQSKRIMGSALAGLGGETIKNIGAITELISPKYGKPIAQLGQAMTNVASEANPVMGTIGQIGAYALPVSLINKGGELLASGTTIPKLGKAITNVAGNMGLGFLTTEGTGKEGFVDRAKSAALAAGLSAGLPIVGGGVSKLSKFLRGPEQTAQMANAVEKAREVGYVIPPTQANESLLNRLLEGTAGKITTQQNASAKNQEITHNLVTKALNLPENEIITPKVLENIRSGAGNAYENLKLTGRVTPDKTYHQALDNIVKDFRTIETDFPADKLRPEVDLIESLKSKSFEVNSALAKIKTLRLDANKAYSQGDASLGNVNKKAANAIEDAIEKHLIDIDKPELLQQFKDARQLIAKTYTVEKALNSTSGTIDAKKLASELKKGKPLTDELKTVAEFSGQFPKATQTTEMMGSRPQINPLDVGAAGILSSLTNPSALATLALRPTARSLALSPFVQNRLVQQPINESSQNLSNLARMLMLQQTTQGTQP
jgi:hypothetical protein